MRKRAFIATTMLTAAALNSTSAPAGDHDAVVTSRPCTTGQTTAPTPGPACLIAHSDLGALPPGANYWHIDTFPDEASANAAKSARGTVVVDFGKVWLFTVEQKHWRAGSGTHVADVGPLPLTRAASFSAEYVHSFFTPGTTAPVHKHSGPEGFFAIEGDTCLEMPGGVHTGAGPGNQLVMPGGPPMLLMATGTTPRKAFALILHDSALPATTRVDDWQPAGLCKR